MTLEPIDHEVLRRLAEMQGRSISAVIRELVDGVRPGLERVIELGEAYEAASLATREIMADATQAAEAELGPQLAELREATQAVIRRVRELGG